MIAGAMIIGLGGAILSGAAALAAGHSLPTALLFYAVGGSVTVVAAAVLGSRRA